MWWKRSDEVLHWNPSLKTSQLLIFLPILEEMIHGSHNVPKNWASIQHPTHSV